MLCICSASFKMLLTGIILICLVPVFQKVDNAIHQINLNPFDNAIGFPNIYPLGSDLSTG